MSACASCGADGRGRWFALLLVAPVLLGALAAIFVVATRGRFPSLFVAAGVTLAFGAFVALLVRYALALLRGRACPSCGRTPSDPS